MPRLPQPTAEGRQGILALPQPSARQFGSEAFGDLTEFGQKLQEVGHRIQEQQDKIDLANLAGAHDIGMEAVKSRVLQEPDSSKHAALFKQETAALQANLFDDNPTISSAVKRAFAVHVAGANAKDFIDVSHQAQAQRADKAVADFANTETRLTERAALEPDPAKAAQHLELANDLRNGMVRGGLMKASVAQARQASAQDRYWSIYAQTRPQELLNLVNHPQDGNIAGMDSEKRNVYVNLAISTLHAQQSQADQTQTQLDKALKDKQEANAGQLKADVIEGKPVQHLLAPLLRARELDQDKVNSIIELQTKMTQVPDMGKYQRGLATQEEAQLSRSKYDNKPFDPSTLDRLHDEYMSGRLLKDEFVHLSGLARGVQDHKNDPANGAKNQDISHAVANLDQVMQTANKLTGFSALGEQATANAKEYFYRRVQQEPNTNPWDIMHEAEARFKPLVEKQQGLSKTDQLLLNDAKIDAQAKMKIITPAAAKAYQDQSQDERGRKAVAEALKALPPPPEPGFLERMFQKKEPARKAPGVMGE